MIKETFRNSSLLIKIGVVLFLVLVGLIVFIPLGIFLSAAIFQMNIASVISSLSSIEASNVALLKFLQSMYSVGMFVFPAIVAAWLFGNSILGYLQLNKLPNISILLAIIIVFISTPIINILVQWNEGIQFPEYLKSIEQFMREMEDNAKQTTDLFLKTTKFSIYLANIVVLAIIPAIGEELLFRGVLQKLLQKHSKNIHLAIWLSAFLFSALHFQFYGFVPRMMLGALFGYLFFWSGNLWIPIIAHFFNNFIAVSIYYFNNNLSENLDQVGLGEHEYAYAISSIILFSVLLFYFYKINVKRATKPLID